MIASKSPIVPATEGETSIDLRWYLGLFLRWWWVIILVTLLAGVTAFLVSRQMTPIYQASTTLYINEAPSNKTTDYNAILASERLVRTYAQMIGKRPVLQEVITRLNLSLTPEQLAGSITVTPVRDTQLIVVDVEQANPNLAAAIANAVHMAFSEQLLETQTSRFAASKESLQAQIAETERQLGSARAGIKKGTEAAEIDRLETRINQYEQTYTNLILRYEEVRMAEAQTISNVVQVEQAVTPTHPVRPKTLQNTLLAVAVGLMLSVAGIFAYDALDDTIKDPEEITRLFRLPILGVIARHDNPEKWDELITRTEPRSPVTESFRSLRTSIQYASVNQPIRTLLVTSPNQSDGKTSIAANLGVVIAQSGRRVVVLDADLHRPHVHHVFQAEYSPGLSSLFVQPDVHLNGSLQLTAQENLRVVTSGELPPNPSELLGSNKMGEILDAVLDQSDLAILDAPPVLTVTDAVVLAPITDGVLLVLQPGETRLGALKATIEQLRHVNANLIGVVLNNVEIGRANYGYYYKQYYYKDYEQCLADQELGRRKQKKVKESG